MTRLSCWSAHVPPMHHLLTFAARDLTAALSKLHFRVGRVHLDEPASHMNCQCWLKAFSTAAAALTNTVHRNTDATQTQHRHCKPDTVTQLCSPLLTPKRWAAAPVSASALLLLLTAPLLPLLLLLPDHCCCCYASLPTQRCSLGGRCCGGAGGGAVSRLLRL
jgi:hypothetical protein